MKNKLKTKLKKITIAQINSITTLVIYFLYFMFLCAIMFAGFQYANEFSEKIRPIIVCGWGYIIYLFLRVNINSYQDVYRISHRKI